MEGHALGALSCGNPTDAQIRLYERWAEGGLTVSIIGEVQGSPNFAEKPGNLVLGPGAELDRFTLLAQRGAVGIFNKLDSEHSFWKVTGWLGVASAFLMNSFYCLSFVRDK